MYDDQDIKNNNILRTIDAIYLHPALTLQEGHEVMDLATGKVVTRLKWTLCGMTKIVIKQAEDLPSAHGITLLKFCNHRRKHLIPTLNDLPEKVEGGQVQIENLLEENVKTSVNNIPLADDDPTGELSSDSTEELDEAVNGFAKQLCGYNPEAMQEMKQMFWQGTEHWDELLAQRAAISGRLVLSEFTKETLKRFK